MGQWLAHQGTQTATWFSGAMAPSKGRNEIRQVSSMTTTPLPFAYFSASGHMRHTNPSGHFTSPYGGQPTRLEFHSPLGQQTNPSGNSQTLWVGNRHVVKFIAPFGNKPALLEISRNPSGVTPLATNQTMWKCHKLPDVSVAPRGFDSFSMGEHTAIRWGVEGSELLPWSTDNLCPSDSADAFEFPEPAERLRFKALLLRTTFCPNKSCSEGSNLQQGHNADDSGCPWSLAVVRQHSRWKMWPQGRFVSGSLLLSTCSKQMGHMTPNGIEKTIGV